jgi:hypothetical protein
VYTNPKKPRRILMAKWASLGVAKTSIQIVLKTVHRQPKYSKKFTRISTLTFSRQKKKLFIHPRRLKRLMGIWNLKQIDQ